MPLEHLLWIQSRHRRLKSSLRSWVLSVTSLQLPEPVAVMVFTRKCSISQSPVLLFLIIHPWQQTVRKLSSRYQKLGHTFSDKDELPPASLGSVLVQIPAEDDISGPNWLPASIEIECSTWATETIEAIEIILEHSTKKRPRRASSLPCMNQSGHLSDEAFGVKLVEARRRVEQRLESGAYSNSSSSSSFTTKQ